LGCSPIKAVRELGLERRETVGAIRAVYKSGYVLGTPEASCGTRPLVSRERIVTIRQVVVLRDHAGQSAGKAGHSIPARMLGILRGHMPDTDANP
jgi:hypothetical protein